MVRENELREGEVAIELPSTEDAGLVFIGRIRTPSKTGRGASRKTIRPAPPAP